jgi:hypothetical protein
MLFRNTLLRNALHAQFLTLSQLANDRAQALWIGDDRIPNPLVCARRINNKIAGIDLHDLIASTSSMEREGHAASLAVLFAIAVPRVLHIVHVFRNQRDETKSMAKEFVGKDRSISLNLYQVDGHGGNLGQDDTSDGVREGEVDALQFKVYMVCASLQCA